MALKIEGIVNGGMHAQEPLRGARRLESLHFALSPSHRLMRVLGSIVARAGPLPAPTSLQPSPAPVQPSSTPTSKPASTLLQPPKTRP